jgi:hypothetical protein
MADTYKLDHERLYLLTSLKAQAVAVLPVLREMACNAEIVELGEVAGLIELVHKVSDLQTRAFVEIELLHDQLHAAGHMLEEGK